MKLKDIEAAERLGLKVQTLRNWRSQYKGPKWIKMGTSVVYDSEDLDEYSEQHKINPETFFAGIKSKGKGD